MRSLTRHNRLSLGSDAPIVVEEHTLDGEFPIHWHNYFELEIILSGRGTYTVNDKEYAFPENNVFILTPTDFHHIKAEEHTEIINISFREDAIDERNIGRLLGTGGTVAYSKSEDAYNCVTSAAALLRRECTLGGECSEQLLAYILKCILWEGAGEAYPSAKARGGIKSAISYMHIHFRENISLRTVAAQAGYHPTYFSEVFREATGESYIEMLTRLRLGSARTMLANGFSVSDACFLSGFGSLSGFLAVFKKHLHMSPREYRARYIDSKNSMDL